MKELKLYQCGFCNTQYTEKSKCSKCEKSHISPLKINKCRYVGMNENHKGYPVSIEVSFENGETATYKR